MLKDIFWDPLILYFSLPYPWYQYEYSLEYSEIVMMMLSHNEVILAILERYNPSLVQINTNVSLNKIAFTMYL